MLEVRRTLGLEVGERRAASHRVEGEAQELLLIHGGLQLAEAICGRTTKRVS